MTEWASNIPADDQTTPPTGGQTIAFEDAALVARCRRGDMEAFGSLVAKYQDRVFNLIYRMTARRSDAEELAQETFLKALEQINQFRGESRFYTWLFRIAANLAISLRRRNGRIRFGPLDETDEIRGAQAAALTAETARRRDPGPEAAAMAADVERRVTQALEELDDEFRVVVLLRDMEDMDYEHIADVLDIPTGTVKSRLHRARCLLKEKLADLVGGTSDG